MLRNEESMVWSLRVVNVPKVVPRFPTRVGSLAQIDGEWHSLFANLE